MTKEALKLALEALEVANSCVDGYYIPKGKTHLPEIEQAITAIKEALANEALEKMAENARELGLDYEPAQEPVAWIDKMVIDVPNQLFYTAPRTWVGLTLDERIELAQDVDWAAGAYCEYAEKIEAKLKEKNT